MSLTVKQVLDEFCDRINQPRETSYVGASAPAARQYVSLLKFIGEKLLEEPGGWFPLKRIYTFTTVTNQANYQLPGDFLRLLTGTQWSVTNQIPLMGPLSNARLAFQTYGVNIATPFAGWQVNGAQGYIYNTVPYTQKSSGYFQISPPGQDNTTQLAIAYTSNNYVWPANWVASTSYAAGAIVTGVNNMYYTTAGGTSGSDRPDWATGSDDDGTVTWSVYHEPYTITADTDFVLLDSDLFVEGMRWAWYQSKQQLQMAKIIRADWMDSVKNSIGRQQGAVLTNAGYDPTAQWEWPVTPVGSWPGVGDV